MKEMQQHETTMNARKLRDFLLCIALSAGVVLLDQISKQIAAHFLAGKPPLEIFSFFQLALVFNRGAAFGFLHNAGGWQHVFLGGVAVAVSVAIVVWMWRLRGRDVWLGCALALVLGGALGNLTDRIFHQAVIDFIVLHYRHWFFPAFNFADSAITIGAIFVIIDSLGWRGIIGASDS